MIYKNYVLIFITGLFLFLSCAYNKGSYLARDNSKNDGFIKSHECYDKIDPSPFKSAIKFKKSKYGKSSVVPYTQIKEFITGQDTFFVIQGQNIKDIVTKQMYYGDEIVIAKPLIRGPVSLYIHCQVKYMSTMVSTKKYKIILFLIKKENESHFYRIPHQPELFIKLAGLYFKDYGELYEKIKNIDYTRKISDSKPGYITEIEHVNEGQIISFIKHYNMWKKLKNN